MLLSLRSGRRPALILALAALLPACADEAPLPSEPQLTAVPAFSTVPASGEIATLRRVTARYHDQAAAFIRISPQSIRLRVGQADYFRKDQQRVSG